jgi:hypothetical protein
MYSYQQCWFYQCPNPGCNCVGVTNDIVLEHRCSDGVVRCPLCSQGMERIREASPGEYDPEKQEELAKWATAFKVTFIPPWEADRYLSGQAGALSPPQPELAAEPVAQQPQEASFLTEEDTAGILKISVKAIRQLVKIGKLGSIRLNKRKQVFTRAMIEEFLQHQAGSCGLKSGGHQQASRTFFYPNKKISLEESRSLLKNLRKDSSSLDRDLKPISMKRRG